MATLKACVFPKHVNCLFKCTGWASFEEKRAGFQDNYFVWGQVGGGGGGGGSVNGVFVEV